MLSVAYAPPLQFFLSWKKGGGGDVWIVIQGIIGKLLPQGDFIAADVSLYLKVTEYENVGYPMFLIL
jgi:hypothetical protein